MNGPGVFVGLKLHSPVVLAAGVLGDSPTKLGEAYDTGIGAVVTKPLTVAPRPPRPEPTIVRTKTGWLNSAGLANPGASEFADQLGRPDFPVIVSLAGEDPIDFGWMVGLFKHVVGFELSLSCPNVRGMGDELGDDPNLVAMIVRETKSATTKPVFVKIAHHMITSAIAATRAGADGVTAINTIRAALADRAAGATFYGGLSGPPVREVVIRTIHDVSQRGITVMGCGGVSTWEDAADLIVAGASIIQVGSIAMDDPAIPADIASGLAEWADGREAGNAAPSAQTPPAWWAARPAGGYGHPMPAPTKSAYSWLTPEDADSSESAPTQTILPEANSRMVHLGFCRRIITPGKCSGSYSDLGIVMTTGSKSRLRPRSAVATTLRVLWVIAPTRKPCFLSRPTSRSMAWIARLVVVAPTATTDPVANSWTVHPPSLIFIPGKSSGS